MYEKLIAQFEHIFIDRLSLDSPLAARFQSLFPAHKITFVDERPFPESSRDLSAREFNRSKKNIFITPFKGQFFKRCPGSRPGLACCNYFVLNWGLQCDMNCSYCYLQSFINTPVLTIYSNLSDALTELQSLSEIPNLRVGTGETVDSLSLDPLTLYSREMIDFFCDFPKWTLEFKTKSAFVDQFLDTPHVGNVVVSWSVNPEHIVSREEHGTASLEARLSAATRCREHGFPISFHIDPMIWHKDWRANYATLVDSICERFTPSDVPYLSVGALRFQPEQRAMMRERFGLKSYVTRAETFLSRDGKLRYDANLRQEMFSFIVEKFKSHSTDWRLFMCMETPETWLKVAGESPFKTSQLHDLFNRDPVLAVGRQDRPL